MYYLRTKPAANAIQFTVDKSKLKSSSNSNDIIEQNEKGTLQSVVCSIENKDECLMCG